jgi:hypothetical protein
MVRLCVYVSVCESNQEHNVWENRQMEDGQAREGD